MASYSKTGEVDWGAVATGAVIGAVAGATLGAGTAAVVAGSATASTSAVMAGLGVGGAATGGVAAGKAAEQLRPYAQGLGHHPAAQAAFRGDLAYNYRTALAVPKTLLEKMNISHSTITGFQQGLYRAFAQTGKTLNWDTLAKIETQALTKAGVDAKVAEAWVTKAIQSLKDSGVICPTRIPWGD